MGEPPVCDRAVPVPIATTRLLVRMMIRITDNISLCYPTSRPSCGSSQHYEEHRTTTAPCPKLPDSRHRGVKTLKPTTRLERQPPYGKHKAKQRQHCALTLSNFTS